MTQPDPEPVRAQPANPASSSPASWFTGARAGTAALAVSLLALGLAAAPYAGGGDFGARVRAYLVANPQVLDEVVAARQAGEEQQVAQAINAVAQSNAGLLAPDPRDPSYGPADAKVTVIEFFDFRCPGCKSVSPEYLQLITDNPDVRFVFKDWPILDREGDTTSNYAARAALAAHREGKYLAVHQALMATPSLTPAAVDRVLLANGVALPEAKAAIASTDITRHIVDIQTVATTLGLRGTPTFFINGKVSASIDPADIAKAIAAAK